MFVMNTRRAAISVLNNLKNNQIVIENYEIFCVLYEKAILCKECSLAPLFSDGSLIVKQKINDDCIDLIINFSVNFTEKGSILANLECLRLDFFAQNGFSEDDTAPTIKAIENRQQQLFLELSQSRAHVTMLLRLLVARNTAGRLLITT